MLCKKIEINQSKRFTQTTETKIYELQRFPQIRMGINISVFLSESYIQKKNPSFDSVTQIYTEFRNFISFLSANFEENWKNQYEHSDKLHEQN